MPSVISFSHISKTFLAEGKKFKALEDVTFDVPSGSFLASLVLLVQGRARLFALLTVLKLLLVAV